MVRTERLGVTEDRGGMLVDRPSKGLAPRGEDLRGYLTAEKVSRHLRRRRRSRVLEVGQLPAQLHGQLQAQARAAWRRARTRCVRGELAELLEDGDGLLDIEQIEAYGRVDPGNARLRALMADIVDTGAWRLLWMPPSLPYYRLGPPFDDPEAGRCHQAARVLVMVGRAPGHRGAREL